MIRAAVLAFTLSWEGGYVNHPADSGGPTNHGVTQKTYDAWRASQGHAPLDVQYIANPEVSAIFEAGYWCPSGAAECAPPLDLVVFDTAVLFGPTRAVRWLQSALGTPIDGVIGPLTRAAIATSVPRVVAHRMLVLRSQAHRDRVQARPDQAVFLSGWLRRCDALAREVG